MHELSIAMSMIEGASEEALSRGGAQVHAVHLKLGALSGVVKDALLFSYEVASNGTLLEGSRPGDRRRAGSDLLFRVSGRAERWSRFSDSVVRCAGLSVRRLCGEELELWRWRSVSGLPIRK